MGGEEPMFYKRIEPKCKQRVSTKTMPHNPSDKTSSVLGDIAGCVRFFSRLPVPAFAQGDDPAKIPNFARSAWALPLAGLVIAIPALAGVLFLHAVGAPALVSAFVFVSLTVLTSGGLHEDGLADMADGFSGGTTRDKKLMIMKDSRIGAHGVLALILVTGLKIAALAHLFTSLGFGGFAAMLVLAITASRFAMLVLWHGLRNARPDGLSAQAGRPERRALEIAGGIIVILLILFAPLLGTKAIIALCATLILTIALVGSMAMRNIGGQTGDILGASQQIAETAILTVLALTAT